MLKSQAPEIIAVTIGASAEAVSDGRIKNRPAPPVYKVAGVIYCSPASRHSPPSGWRWTRIGHHAGRDVFQGTPNSVPVAQAAGAES
jgi:hypothetical protein